MHKLTSYTGKTALITGAASGFGRILAIHMAKKGARVALVSLPSEKEALDEVAKEIESNGGSSLVFPCDVSVRDQVEATTKAVLEEMDHIDILVNNAGYGHHRPFRLWDLGEMEHMMRVNYFGALYFTKMLLDRMIERRQGWIVYLSSVAGKIAPPEEAPYAASKSAVAGLAESLAIELKDAGIHVLTVCPGVFNTRFFDKEALDRMPPVSQKMMNSPDVLVNAILNALEKGKHDITVPSMKAAYITKAVAPDFFRKQVYKNTLGKLPPLELPPQKD